MTETLPPRRFVDEAPDAVIARLPRIGRVMIINSREGVTHERIGIIDTISRDGDELVVLGPDHDCRIHLPSIAGMVLDLSSAVREKPYPRIDFLDAAGATLFSAVSFAGLDPFLSALEGLRAERDAGDAKAMDFQRGSEALPDDPGLVVLSGMAASGEPVAVAIQRPGFSQRWEGVVEAITPTMGFINIMIPSFHFHLRAGAVDRWERRSDAGGVTLSAVAADGHPLGLTLDARSETAFAAG